METITFKARHSYPWYADRETFEIKRFQTAQVKPVGKQGDPAFHEAVLNDGSRVVRVNNVPKNVAGSAAEFGWFAADIEVLERSDERAPTMAKFIRKVGGARE